MFQPDQWSVAFAAFLFGLAALIIGVFGRSLTLLADRLADRTGLGEALTGAFFLGAATSLPEIATTSTAAATGHAELAVSNALGGIAAQTVFLVLADISYRRANLEHAAASIANVMQGALVVVLLTLPILGFLTPNLGWQNIHLVTPFMFGTYIYGLHLVFRAQNAPMWRPEHTPETRLDEPDSNISQSPALKVLWLQFLAVGLIVGLGGWVVAHAGIVISARTGLSETVVGTIFTAVSTSLPELVTVITAVRHGALTLAVGGVLGGNAFDTLLVAISDVVHSEGSIYVHIPEHLLFLSALTILMTGILLMGLVQREKHGVGNIGFESFFILTIYVGGITYMVFHH